MKPEIHKSHFAESLAQTSPPKSHRPRSTNSGIGVKRGDSGSGQNPKPFYCPFLGKLAANYYSLVKKARKSPSFCGLLQMFYFIINI